MPTSSQALHILRDVNTMHTPKLWCPRPLDEPDVKPDDEPDVKPDDEPDVKPDDDGVYSNGEGLTYETLAFHKRIPLSFPETRLGACQSADVHARAGESQSVDASRSPLFPDHVLPPAEESFDHGVRSPTSACISDTDLFNSNVDCPVLTYNGLNTALLANSSWFKDIQRRNPKCHSYWNFRATVLEAFNKFNQKHEDHMAIIGLLGAKEKQKIQRIVKKKTAPAEAIKNSSLYTRESGDKSIIELPRDKDWIFTGKDKFSILSGNPTSALRRRKATRVNIPSNFMDFTLRFGNGVKLNNIFEARGQHVKEEYNERQASQREVPVPSGAKTVSIAEGVDLQDLMPSRKRQSDSHSPTDESSKAPDNFNSLTSGNKNRSNDQVEMPKFTQTTRPSLMKAGLVEHGFCRPEYDPTLQSMTSRVIEVEGSEPGARRGQIHEPKGKRHGFGEVEEHSEQNVDNGRRYEQICTEYLNRNDRLNLQLDNGNSRKYMPTDDEFSIFDTSRDHLHHMVSLKDFSFKNDAQTPVREIGLYQETRKKALASVESMATRPTSTSSSGESDSFTTTVASLSAIPSPHHHFKRQGESPHSSTRSVDSGPDEFSGKLQTGQMQTDSAELRRDLPKRPDHRPKSAGTEKGSRTWGQDDILDFLNNDRSLGNARRKECPDKGRISFKGQVILPPSKTTIAQAKTLDAYFEEEVQDKIRRFEAEETEWYKNVNESRTEGEADAKKRNSPQEEELAFSCYWQNEQEEQLFKRIKSKVLRMRKVLPTPAPNKLCFVSNTASCSHQEVKEEIESSGSVTVTHLQYDPVYLGEGTPDQYTGLWIFEISKDSDKTNLLLRGFKLKGRPMNVRHLDDVTMEEYRAFQLYHAIRLEQRKKKLNRRFKRR